MRAHARAALLPDGLIGRPQLAPTLPLPRCRRHWHLALPNKNSSCGEGCSWAGALPHLHLGPVPPTHSLHVQQQQQQQHQQRGKEHARPRPNLPISPTGGTCRPAGPICHPAPSATLCRHPQQQQGVMPGTPRWACTPRAHSRDSSPLGCVHACDACLQDCRPACAAPGPSLALIKSLFPPVHGLHSQPAPVAPPTGPIVSAAVWVCSALAASHVRMRMRWSSY